MWHLFWLFLKPPQARLLPVPVVTGNLAGEGERELLFAKHPTLSNNTRCHRIPKSSCLLSVTTQRRGADKEVGAAQIPPFLSRRSLQYMYSLFFPNKVKGRRKKYIREILCLFLRKTENTEMYWSLISPEERPAGSDQMSIWCKQSVSKSLGNAHKSGTKPAAFHVIGSQHLLFQGRLPMEVEVSGS